MSAPNQIGASKSNAPVAVTVIKSVVASELAVGVDTTANAETVPNGTLAPFDAYDTVPVPAPAPVAALQYSAAEIEPSAAGGTSKNAPCPCGSGKKYKRCHGQS